MNEDENSFNIQDYKIDKTISKSKTSIVKHASKSDNSQYALKIISQANKNARFNSAILMPLICHPNIVETVEIVETGGYVYQFMPLYEYGDLLHFLKQKELPQPLAIKVCEQLLSAVEALHALGICHRDIKPENILMGRHAVIRLGDFNSASLAFDGTVTGRVGSFEYSSPEAIKADGPYDGFKSDMWSVGVVFYVIFNRRMPFSNIGFDFDYRTAIKNIDYSNIPKGIAEIVKLLLSYDPIDRPTATECLTSEIFAHNLVLPANNLVYHRPNQQNGEHHNQNFNGGNAGLACAIRMKKRIRPPLSSIRYHVDPRNDANSMISKLSQALEIPITDFRLRIQESNANTEKLLLLLYRRRSLETLIDEPIDSIPKSMFPNVAAPDNNNTSLVRKVGLYQTTASNVYSALHNFLLQKKNFLISTPLSDSPSIILKNGHHEAKIAFQVTDNDDGKSTIVLWAGADAIQIMCSILKLLDQYFTSNV